MERFGEYVKISFGCAIGSTTGFVLGCVSGNAGIVFACMMVGGIAGSVVGAWLAN